MTTARRKGSVDAIVLWTLYDEVKLTLLPNSSDSSDLSLCHFGCDCRGDPKQESSGSVLLNGDVVCPHCYRVTARELDARADGRARGSFPGGGDGRSTRCAPGGGAAGTERCGPPTNPLFPGFATSSVIGYGGSGGDWMRFSRMRKYQMWSSLSYQDRSMFKLSEAINTYATRGAFNAAILEDAKTLYHQASNAMVSRGDMRKGVIASCVFMACKRNQAPRSAKEIAKIFDTTTTTVTRGCKRLQDLIDIDDVRACEPVDFVRRFCTRLNRPDIAATVEGLISAVEERDAATDHCPTAVAATCVFLIGMRAHPPITRSEVATACGVAEVTIAKCAKKVAAAHCAAARIT